MNFVMQPFNDLHVRVIGYCEKSVQDIKHLIYNGRINQLLNSRGEFTVIYTINDFVGVVTSYIGAMQYFYFYDGHRFVHGDSIIQIIKTLDLNWEWDWQSLGDLCELENLTDNRTLHKSIKRVPPGSILNFNKRLVIWSTSLIDSIKTKEKEDAVEALEIFNKETSFWVSQNPYLSLSGGFDSRVILSSMLSQQIYPTLVTIGTDDSSDIQVARKIANSFALNHITVSLNLEEFLENGEHIANITNGSKPACHWNTYLYPKKAMVPRGESFYVGTLGEFARCYYFDKGVVSLLVDGLGNQAQHLFWKTKLKRHRTFKDLEIRLIASSLADEVNHNGQEKRALRNSQLCKGDFLSGGSRYYLEQRVPNFYANGIRMYNDTSQWRSPFHNTYWLRKIWNMSENWKLGSNWHRFAIQKNFPQLLDFPEEKGFIPNKMLKKAPPLYWLPIMQRMKYNTYDQSEIWYKHNKIREFILDNRLFLDDLFEPSLPETILAEHRTNGGRVRAISLILTILYFKKALASTR